MLFLRRLSADALARAGAAAYRAFRFALEDLFGAPFLPSDIVFSFL